MKKAIFACAVLLCLGLTACGGNVAAVATSCTSCGATVIWHDETEAPQVESPLEPVQLLPAAEFDLEDYTYVLTEVASFQKSDGIGSTTDFMVKQDPEDEDAFYLLSYTGQDLLGKSYHNYNHFGDGLTVVIRMDGEVPTVNLVNAHTGKIYIAENAASIQQLSDRYYYVIFATEKTDDMEDYFIYFTDRFFSFGPEEGDPLYKGYGKVYDLEKEQYVKGLLVEDADYTVEVCGDTVCVKVDYYTYDLYLPDGSVIRNVEDVELCANTMIQSAGNESLIYDSRYQLLSRVCAASPMMDGDFSYSDRYFSFRSDDLLVGVVDINGTEILPAKYRHISAIGDYLIACNEDNRYGLYLGDGTQILKEEYNGIYQVRDFPWFRLEKEDAEYLYLPGGKMIDLAEFGGNYLPCARRVNEDDYSVKEYLVYGTGDVITLNWQTELDTALVYSEEGLIDLIHGTTLMDGNFGRMTMYGDYLYVRNNDMYTVYHVQFGK